MVLSIVHSIFPLKNWVHVRMRAEKWGWKNGAVNCSQHILFAPRRQLPAGRPPVLTEQPTINIFFLELIFYFSRPTVSVSPTVVGSLFTLSLAKPSLSFDIHPSTSHNRFILTIDIFFIPSDCPSQITKVTSFYVSLFGGCSLHVFVPGNDFAFVCHCLFVGQVMSPHLSEG